MNSPSSETLSTEDAVQTIGGRNTRGDKSESPGRRNEVLKWDRQSLFVVCHLAELCPKPAMNQFVRRISQMATCLAGRSLLKLSVLFWDLFCSVCL